MKKKFLLAVIVIAISIISSGAISVSAETDGIYTYSVSDNVATITGCNTSANGDIIIPPTLGGYPVTSIGNNAFESCTNLTNITIPNSVTNIGMWAFAGCSNLSSITIPNSVTNIEMYAFTGCSGLENLTIGNGVTNIEMSAFSNCISLVSITIPNNVINIGDGAFSACRKLENIIVDNDNPNYCSIDGVLFDKTKTKLMQYPAGKSDIEYIIPNTVTNIAYAAFSSCNSLSSIIIPDNVTNIGKSAFSQCSNLVNIRIPDNVKSIENDTFGLCSSLVSITIPNNVTSIEQYAFWGCSSLENLIIPISVTNIGSSAFYGCSNLADIDLPNSITYIGSKAFYNTAYYNNTSNWENNVLYIGNHLIVANTSIGGKYIIKNGTISIAYGAFYDCINLESITIPKSVTVINTNAFRYCSNLTGITIPSSIARIDSWAFEGCDSLTDVYYNGSKAEWKTISIDYYYNKSLKNATIHFIPNTRTFLSNNDKTFTITPINVENGKTVILALYNGKQLIEIQSTTYAGKPISFTTTKSYTNAKVFVWENFQTLIPICEAEIVK